MKINGNIECPVENCSFTGTVSSVAHHISELEDKMHGWGALGFQHSWDFRKSHANDLREDTPTEGLTADTSYKSTHSPEPLKNVPGIGNKRATTLKTAGYEKPEEIADASISELSQVDYISESIANCIRVMAREECEYPDTFITQLADSVGADREEVSEAYAALAGVSVPPEESKQTLRLLFDSDEGGSILELSEYSVRFRHFLFQDGFEKINDVARATIPELTDIAYIGENLAGKIRESAREMQDIDDVSPTSSSNRDGATDSPAQQNTGNETASAIGNEDSSPELAADTEGPVIAGSFPEELKDHDQWLLWKQTDDGRKIPRAPWVTEDALTYVSAMDPSNWVSFEEAVQWQSKLPHDLELAYVLTREDDIVFLDLDDVIRGENPSSEAQRLVDQANSYTAVSTSGTGLHIFLRGRLPDEIKSLTGKLDEAGKQSIEIYDRNRFVAVTGDHLDETPPTLTSGGSLLANLEKKFASVGSETPDGTTSEPRQEKEYIRNKKTTEDIQDIFDAIYHTDPSDIHMRSSLTQKRSDGTASYDPSWVQSESGTRLAVLDDGWIYRKGMIALDALQVVALEERIITDERSYPESDNFWEAVEKLRDRGAHIPEFKPEDEPVSESATVQTDDEIDRWEVAKRINYGNPVRTYLHPYDRDYQEDLALELTPILIDAAESLHLTADVTNRAAEIYAKGHAAGIVPGAAHESSLGAALRIASIEADAPRPLPDIADSVGESPKSVRKKFQRMMKETDISERVGASELIIDPVEYVPYMARRLTVSDDSELLESVRQLLNDVEHGGGSNPMSEVAAAFYVAMKTSGKHSVTQRVIADAADLSTVTIRNNYRKYADEE